VNPAGVVCVPPYAEHRGISLSTINDANADTATLDLTPPPKDYVAAEEARRLDVWFFTGCGLVCLSLGGLRVNLGRKRHRRRTRKSVLRLRMMA
jgi:hypothetical protein